LRLDAIVSWAAPVLVSILVLMAGCSGGSHKASAKNSLAPAPPATVTSDTGSVEGLVVDAEQAPIAAVDVALVELTQSIKSDAAGRFVFNNLPPGAYKLVAQRLGYESFAKKVDVGVANVTRVTVVLHVLSIPVEPFVTVLPFKGFIQCGANPLFPVNACGAATGQDKDRFVFPIDRNQSFKEVVIELVWKPATAATGQELEIELCDDVSANQEPLCFNANYWKYHTSGSPNVMRREDLPVKTKAEFLAGVAAGLTETSVAFQQDFNLYVSVCYVAKCADDYSVIPK
jgi:hypothetical protein